MSHRPITVHPLTQRYLSHEPPSSCLDAPPSSCAISVHHTSQITTHHAIVPLRVIYTHTSPLSWVHLSRPGLVTMCMWRHCNCI